MRPVKQGRKPKATACRGRGRDVTGDWPAPEGVGPRARAGRGGSGETSQHEVTQGAISPINRSRARRVRKCTFCNSVIPKFPGPPFKQNGQRISETKPVLQSTWARCNNTSWLGLLVGTAAAIACSSGPALRSGYTSTV